MPAENCNVCGFKFAREPGYYFGVLTPTLSLLSLGVGALFALSALFLVGLHIPTVLAAGAVGIGIGTIGFFRTAIAIFISFDHLVDPPSQAFRTDPR